MALSKISSANVIFPIILQYFFYKNRKINLARKTQEKGDIVEYKVSRYYN